MSRRMIECPPRDMPHRAHPVPPMWNSGMATSETVSAPMRKTWSASVRMHAMFCPEIIAPLGRPVVPEVYSWVTTSSGPGSKPGSDGWAGASASRHRANWSRGTQVRTQSTMGLTSLTAAA